jgi:hypothetical protein
MDPQLIIITVLLVGLAAVVGVAYWPRRRGADEPDAAPAAAEAIEPIGFASFWPEPPRGLRLEAAAPEEVAVGQPFDLVAAILPPGERPTLPEALAAAVAPPPVALGALAFSVRVDAQGFVCHGPATQTVHYLPDGAPSIVVFSLSAERSGDAAIRVMVHQGLTEIGRVRLPLQAVDGEPAGGSNVGLRATLAARPPQMAEHLLAHVIAETYTADEARMLAAALDADYDALPGRTPFTRGLDLARDCARRGRAGELAERVMAERPHWRAAIRGNKRAERVV